MNVPVGRHQGLEDERINFIHLILESLGEGSLGPPFSRLPNAPAPGLHLVPPSLILGFNVLMCTMGTSGQPRGLGVAADGVPSSAVDGPPMWASAHVSRPPKRPSKMGFDEVWSACSACRIVGGFRGLHPSTQTPIIYFPQVFVISLARRPERRQRMLSSLWEMEIAARVVDAVDGR